MTQVDQHFPFAPDLERALPLVIAQAASGRQIRWHWTSLRNLAETAIKAMGIRDTE